MKTKKKYLPLYEKWMESGLPGYGLCSALNSEDDMILLGLFEPKSYDEYPCFQGEFTNDWCYWASDGFTDGYTYAGKFTPLRQTIVLFMAAMNGEL